MNDSATPSGSSYPASDLLGTKSFTIESYPSTQQYVLPTTLFIYSTTTSLVCRSNTEYHTHPPQNITIQNVKMSNITQLTIQNTKATSNITLSNMDIQGNGGYSIKLSTITSTTVKIENVVITNGATSMVVDTVTSSSLLLSNLTVRHVTTPLNLAGLGNTTLQVVSSLFDNNGPIPMTMASATLRIADTRFQNYDNVPSVMDLNQVQSSNITLEGVLFQNNSIAFPGDTFTALIRTGSGNIANIDQMNLTVTNTQFLNNVVQDLSLYYYGQSGSLHLMNVSWKNHVGCGMYLEATQTDISWTQLSVTGFTAPAGRSGLVFAKLTGGSFAFSQSTFSNMTLTNAQSDDAFLWLELMDVEGLGWDTITWSNNSVPPGALVYMDTNMPAFSFRNTFGNNLRTWDWNLETPLTSQNVTIYQSSPIGLVRIGGGNWTELNVTSTSSLPILLDLRLTDGQVEVIHSNLPVESLTSTNVTLMISGVEEWAYVPSFQQLLMQNGTFSLMEGETLDHQPSQFTWPALCSNGSSYEVLGNPARRLEAHLVCSVEVKVFELPANQTQTFQGKVTLLPEGQFTIPISSSLWVSQCVDIQGHIVVQVPSEEVAGNYTLLQYGCGEGSVDAIRLVGEDGKDVTDQHCFQHHFTNTALVMSFAACDKPPSGLSGGAIAGIVVGIIAAVALVVAAVGFYFLIYKPRAETRQALATTRATPTTTL